MLHTNKIIKYFRNEWKEQFACKIINNNWLCHYTGDESTSIETLGNVHIHFHQCTESEIHWNVKR